MLGVMLSAAVVLAAAAPATFSDDPAAYTIAVPAQCTVRAKTKTVYAFIDCGKGYARVASGPGSDLPSLQKIVNGVIGNWSNLKLIQNQPGASLGGVTARNIYAEGTSGNEPSSIQMIAATRNGHWYVLVMAAPQAEWTRDTAVYFSLVKAGFHFTAAPPAKKK